MITTLAPALNQVGKSYEARTSVRVFGFPTEPGLIVPQPVRDVQNDIVVTQVEIMNQTVAAGVVTGTLRRSEFVIARPQGSAITDRIFAAPDPTPVSDFDGPSLLRRLNTKPSRILGAADTDEVAFLLDTGAAQAGFLHLSDIRAHPRLFAIRPVPRDTQPPFRYTAAVTRLSRRPHLQGVVDFPSGPGGAAVLNAAGRESLT